MAVSHEAKRSLHIMTQTVWLLIFFIIFTFVFMMTNLLKSQLWFDSNSVWRREFIVFSSSASTFTVWVFVFYIFNVLLYHKSQNLKFSHWVLPSKKNFFSLVRFYICVLVHFSDEIYLEGNRYIYMLLYSTYQAKWYTYTLQCTSRKSQQ